MLRSSLSRKVSRSQMTVSGTISIPRRACASPGKSAVLSVTTPMRGTSALLHGDDERVVRLPALDDFGFEVPVRGLDRFAQLPGLLAGRPRSPVDSDDLAGVRF